MEVVPLQAGQRISCTDGQNVDLLYVKSGSVALTLELTETYKLHLRVTQPTQSDGMLFGAGSENPNQKQVILGPS